MRRVLVVEEDSLVRETLVNILRDEKYYVIAVRDRNLALNCLEREEVDIMVVEERELAVNSFELLDRATQRLPEIVVIVTGESDNPYHIRSILAKDIYDYISRPLTPTRILTLVRRADEKITLMEENRVLRRRIEDRYSFAGITGVSERMQDVFSFILQVSQVKRPILLVGEQGAGKEMIARAIHQYAFSGEKPFFKVRCGSLPQGVLGSGMLYRETGNQSVPVALGGLNEGTVYLEDIHLLPTALQAELAEFLEEHRSGTKRRDIRLIASAEASLEEEVSTGKFRTDLFYFLNALRFEIPSLRDRREDIPFLIDCFLKEMAEETGQPVARINTEALKELVEYDWPGNVTELRNTIEGMLVLSRGSLITPDDIPDHIHGRISKGDVVPIRVGMTLEEAEKVLLWETLKVNRYNKSKTARMLDIGLRTLYRKIKQFDMENNIYTF